MATITIRNLEGWVKRRLRMQAASHERSMEEEARVILRAAMRKTNEEGGLGSRIHQRFMAAGGVELRLPERDQAPRRPDSLE